VIRLVTTGRNRFVLLIGKFALKIPSLRSWRDFLFGLLNNGYEAEAYHTDPAHRVPVLWLAPGGLLLVMPRGEVLSEQEYADVAHVLPKLFAGRSFQPEWKADSFVKLDKQILACDTGWPT
jgi:hypothetical protein